MSYLVALPETLAAAATDAVSIGSVVATANQGVAGATTAVLAAAEDEISAAIAALFSAHGQGYQVLSEQVAVFQNQFVQTLNSAAASYASAEAANASLLEAVELVQQFPENVATGFARVGNFFFAEIFGVPADPAFPATQTGGFTGTPSIINRLEYALLYPVKPLLALTGLESIIASPSHPLLQLLASDIPPLSWFIGNSPPPFLNLLLGQTVSYYSTTDGLNIVQITPFNATGENVVAIHGGAFIFPPSFLHWIHYSVMSYTTGATIQVPIYPLLQEGGTAGLVVPQLSNFIIDQVAQHGSSNVSVIGDSAGGNLALAAMHNIVKEPGIQDIPSRMVLLSPWLDLSMTNPNIGFVQDPLLPFNGAVQIGKLWARSLGVTDPLASPVYSTFLDELPPTYVYAGNLEILGPDAFVLQANAVTQTASQINFVLANGQIHDWLILTIDGLRYWPQINTQLGIAA